MRLSRYRFPAVVLFDGLDKIVYINELSQTFNWYTYPLAISTFLTFCKLEIDRKSENFGRSQNSFNLASYITTRP